MTAENSNKVSFMLGTVFGLIVAAAVSQIPSPPAVDRVPSDPSWHIVALNGREVPIWGVFRRGEVDWNSADQTWGNGAPSLSRPPLRVRLSEYSTTVNGAYAEVQGYVDSSNRFHWFFDSQSWEYRRTVLKRPDSGFVPGDPRTNGVEVRRLTGQGVSASDAATAATVTAVMAEAPCNPSKPDDEKIKPPPLHDEPDGPNYLLYGLAGAVGFVIVCFFAYITVRYSIDANPGGG